MIDKELKDAPIANSVNRDVIQEKLQSDHYVKQFAEQGAKLLEETNRPNIITYAQFEPFIELFNMDKTKYAADENYRISMNRLYNQYTRGLGINLYQPTIVVVSHEDPTELYFLDRKYTQFKSDTVEGKSKRDSVPAAVSRASSTTRDDLLLDASILDLMDANSSPEQKAHFARIRMQSAIIQKNFVERNLSPEKRAELLAQVAEPLPPEETSGEMIFDLNDDED